MKLVYLPWAEECAEFFGSLFESVTLVSDPRDINVIDNKTVVLYGGGEDISPSLYKQKPCKYTAAPSQPSSRDLFEKEVFTLGHLKGAKFLGICRGAQFLCVMAGGKLYQHVTCHGHDHVARIKDVEMSINSTHHQMMDIREIENAVELIGYSHQDYLYFYDYDKKEIQKYPHQHEPEIVYFPAARALAIQGHPEYADSPAGYAKLCRSLVMEKLINA